MNSIELIDSFFKNGTVKSQTSLQTNVPIIFPIDSFCNEPNIHMNFCKAVQSWAKICQKNNCLSLNFINWMKKLYSFKFKYVMTPEISKKFTKDFDTAHEFLLIVSDELINAKDQRGSCDFDELDEMIINVVDVHQRLSALEKTASNYKFWSIIQYLEYYCCVCIHAHDSLKKNGTFEEEILLEIKAQEMPGKESHPRKVPNHHRQSLTTPQQSTTRYSSSQKRPKSQAYPIIETPVLNDNNTNPYQQNQQQVSEYYYPQTPIQQLHPNSQLEIERQQVQLLYSTHLQTTNQPMYIPPPQATDNDTNDIFSWSQYPSVSPNTFKFDPNFAEEDADAANNAINDEELPLPPFAPPPYAPPPYTPPPI